MDQMSMTTEVGRPVTVSISFDYDRKFHEEMEELITERVVEERSHLFEQEAMMDMKVKEVTVGPNGSDVELEFPPEEE